MVGWPTCFSTARWKKLVASAVTQPSSSQEVLVEVASLYCHSGWLVQDVFAVIGPVVQISHGVCACF